MNEQLCNEVVRRVNAGNIVRIVLKRLPSGYMEEDSPSMGCSSMLRKQGVYWQNKLIILWINNGMLISSNRGDGMMSINTAKRDSTVIDLMGFLDE